MRELIFRGLVSCFCLGWIFSEAALAENDFNKPPKVFETVAITDSPFTQVNKPMNPVNSDMLPVLTNSINSVNGPSLIDMTPSIDSAGTSALEQITKTINTVPTEMGSSLPSANRLDTNYFSPYSRIINTTLIDGPKP